MQKRPLVIAIYDPRWYMRVISLLRERGLFFHHYYDPGSVPLGAVFYTDYDRLWREVSWRKDVEVVYDPGHECRELEKAIAKSLVVADLYEEAIVGIDPGSRSSYVVLVDGEYLFSGSGDLAEVVGVVGYVKNCVPAKSVTVRIGSRGRGLTLASLLHRELGGVRIELVPEEKTTPRGASLELAGVAKRISVERGPLRRDLYAAYRIALRKGVEVV